MRRAHSWAGAASIAALTAVLVTLDVSWWFIGPILVFALISFAFFLAWREEYFEGQQAVARADYYQGDAEGVRAEAIRLESINSLLRGAHEVRRSAQGALLDESDVRQAIALQSRLGEWASNAPSRLPADLSGRVDEAGDQMLSRGGLPGGSPAEQVKALDAMIHELSLIQSELREMVLVGKALRRVDLDEGDVASRPSTSAVQGP